MERELDESFFDMVGAKAAVIQDIAINEIKSSIREKARVRFRLKVFLKNLHAKIDVLVNKFVF